MMSVGNLILRSVLSALTIAGLGFTLKLMLGWRLL
jgi:hypothetical protein